MARAVPDPVQQAERVIRRHVVRAFGPRERECLPCYLQRVVADYGCNGTLEWTHRWQEHQRARRIRTGGLTARLKSRGGFCDCEVLLNVYDRDPAAGPSSPCVSDH